jgi:hypothetical protein
MEICVINDSWWVTTFQKTGSIYRKIYQVCICGVPVIKVQAGDNQNAHSDDLPDGFGLA